MKVYAVYARVEIIDKPDWLEDFRRKYQNVYDYHVTFKQPAYIDEAQLSDIQQRLSRIFDGFPTSDHKIQVVFNQIEADSEDGSIMIMAQRNQSLVSLQEKICTDLATYSNYMKPELKEYEENFRPHLTIAFDLDDQFDQAVTDLGQEIRIIGRISEVVLACVNEITPREAKDPANQTIYRF